MSTMVGGRKFRFFIRERSSSGEVVLFSIVINAASDAAEAPKRVAGMYHEPALVLSRKVMPVRNRIIVAASASVPFMSIECSGGGLLLLASAGTWFGTRTYFIIKNQSAIATGSTATNVACQP